VLVENALFATLDPTVRRAELPDGRAVTLTDTVGFVRHLPHQLVDAFRSTLEEVAAADLVVHVVDGSHSDPEAQIAAVREVFGEIGANQVPELLVVNKIDAADPLVLNRLRRSVSTAVFVSAATGEGLDELLDIVGERVPRPEVELQVLVPYDRGELVAKVHEIGEVLDIEHRGEGTYLHARVGPALAAELDVFRVAVTG
jgi:GTP-binding protein HflX